MHTHVCVSFVTHSVWNFQLGPKLFMSVFAHNCIGWITCWWSSLDALRYVSHLEQKKSPSNRMFVYFLCVYLLCFPLTCVWVFSAHIDWIYGLWRWEKILQGIWPTGTAMSPKVPGLFLQGTTAGRSLTARLRAWRFVVYPYFCFWWCQIALNNFSFCLLK